jgi:hypothetical protein
MIGKKAAPYLALLAFLLAQPATATLPPLQPPQYGAYGPLTICEHNVSIAVEADEAVDIVDRVFRVVNDDYVIAAVPMLLSDQAIADAAAPSAPAIITLADGVPAYRYLGVVAPEDRRELVYPRTDVRDPAIFYAVPATAGPRSKDDSGRPMLMIASPSFDGTPSDAAILKRFQRNVDKNSSCIRPSDLAAGKRDYRSAGLVRSFDAPFYPGWYPLASAASPSYHCIGSIGFAIASGEALRRPWTSHRRGASFLTHDGVTVKISGPVEPMQRIDRNDANEHPAGQLHQSNIIYYPSRGVGPPYAAPGVREDGSWLIELGKESASRLEVSFPAGDKAAAGFALLERLEFVAPDDPRCATKR